MLAFGLGTLPDLIAAGLLLNQVRRWLHGRLLRAVSGTLVLGFGIAGLAHTAQLGEQIRLKVAGVFANGEGLNPIAYRLLHDNCLDRADTGSDDDTQRCVARS